jgi:hypothetical protein
MAIVKVAAGTDINAAVAANPPGTTFELGAGIHRIFEGLAPKQDTIFQGTYKAGQFATILSGARVLKGWKFQKRYWWVGGQTQQGADPTPPADCCLPDSMACHFPEDLFIDGELIKRVETLEEVRPGVWFFDYSANRIYIGDSPHGHLIETSVNPRVYQSIGVNNVVMEDMIIEKFASPSAQGAVKLGFSELGGGHWGIQRCELRDNHGAAIWSDTESFIRECYIHHNGDFGLCGAGTNIIVEGNEIAFNNTCGYNPYWGAGGSKWVWTSNLQVIGNWSHHNKGVGLWTDINNIHTLYENNIVEYSELSGIFHEISYEAIIRNNTCRYNGMLTKPWPWWTTGAGIEVNASRNVEVYNNQCEDNWQGITGLDMGRGMGPQGPYELKNFRVHDNVIITSAKDGGGRTGVVNAPDALFERNHYTLKGESLQPFFWTDRNLTEQEWQAIPQDVDGTFIRVVQ